MVSQRLSVGRELPRVSLRQALDRALPQPMAASAALVGYAVLVFAILPRHEPWFDEAQAWLLARDSNPIALITHDIHYEATPALWHLLLMLPAHLHFPYITLNVIGALAALAGTYVLLRFAPFPLWMRMVLPFTYFLFFQYAVSARSYNLMPALLFGVAAVWPRRLTRPYLFATLLALLANVSAHGTLIAAGVFAAHVLDVPRPDWRPLLLARSHLAATAIVGAALLLAAYQLTLPPDQAFTTAGLNFSRTHYESTAAAMVSGAMTSHDMVSFLALGLTLPLLWRGRALLAYALPVLAVVTLSALKYYNVWHEGVIFLVWIFALWIAFERVEKRSLDPVLLYGALAALAVVIAFQLTWSARAYLYDWRQSYSGSRAAAQYIIKHHLETSRIEAGGYAIDPFAAFALQPYFDHNIYANYHQRQAFYVWTSRPLLDRDPRNMAARRPDVVVWAIKFGKASEVPKLPGYDVYHFDGGVFWQSKLYQYDSYFLLVKRRSP